MALLDEVRLDLDVDEASLLLLDASGTVLIPAASSGLPTPAPVGFRVPVGVGFAGRVAAKGGPVVLTPVTPETVLNPALHKRGIQSLVGVPVADSSQPLGVVHIGSIPPRAFTAEDIARLERAAADLAVEVLARRDTEEHIAALVLQRSLLPAASPSITGLDIAARYVPANGDLGGDWYDVFRLPDRRIGVVMGDVAGHGLTAAVVMGRLRSALRAYALEHPDPAEVLRRLDLKISYFEAGAMATVLYGVAEPPYARFSFSSAGHLPPYLVPPEDPPGPIEVEPDPPLGTPAIDTWSRHTTLVDLPAGAALCLFTDGLVERRVAPNTVDGDQIGRGLNRLLAALRPGTADDMCTNVLTELIGGELTEDDIAILVLRRLPD